PRCPYWTLFRPRTGRKPPALPSASSGPILGRMTNDLSTAKNERNTADWQTLRRFIPYLWPHGRPDLRKRIAGAILFVILAKIVRSEEHTSELQSRENLVCRLLL